MPNTTCRRCGSPLNQASLNAVHFEEGLTLAVSANNVPSFRAPICDECARDLRVFLYPTFNGGEQVQR